jgi:hypothetical protein
MLKPTNRGPRIFHLLLVTTVLMVGCAPANYILKGPPTENTRSFKNIEVAKVEVGITESELDPETPLELRRAIIEEIQKTEVFSQVTFELDSSESTIQIQPRIVEFDKGSQAARYLIGFGAGKAHLDVECTFINKEMQTVIAEGTFKTEVGGGWFGGSADPKSMSEDVAKEIAKFLEEGK